MLLNIDSLLDEKKPVYVRNIYKPRSVIVFTFVSPAGRTKDGVIPKTKYPICLNDLANPETIRNTDGLRRLLAKQVLELVDPADAEKELADPEIREIIKAAWDDLSQLQRRTDPQEKIDLPTSSSSPLSSFQNTMLEEIQAKLQKSAENHKNLDIIADPIQSRVQVVIAALNENQKKPREARRELAGLDLSKEDLMYIASNTVPGIVNQYAKGLLANLMPADGKRNLVDNDEEFVDESLKVSLSR